jgi:predicted nucleic acid-binding protein
MTASPPTVDGSDDAPASAPLHHLANHTRPDPYTLMAPRGLVDCIIANVALRSGAEVLAAERDFAAMAQVVPIRLHRSGRR